MIYDKRSVSGKKPLAESERADALMGQYDSFEAASFKLPPWNPDVFIATRGYQTLHDQLAIAPVWGALNIIRTAVLRKGISVQSAITDPFDTQRHQQAQAIADHLQHDFDHILDAYGNHQGLREIVFEMLYAIHVGFSVAEIIWKPQRTGKYAGKWGWARIAPKPAEQIGFDLDERTFAVRSIASYCPGTGNDPAIPVEKVLRYTFAPKRGLPYGSAVGRTVYKHTWSLDFVYRFWNLGLEVHGAPNMMAKASKADMATAYAALKRLRQSGIVVLPENVEAELLQMASGGLDAFEKAVQNHHNQILFAYLNNTLAAGEGRRTGSLAQAKVHQDTQEYSLAFLREDVEEVLNRQLVARWFAYNYGEEAEFCPTVSLGQWDAVDAVNLTNAFNTLVSMGNMHPEEPIIRERLRLPPISPEWAERLEERRESLTPPTGGGNPSESEEEESDDE